MSENLTSKESLLMIDSLVTELKLLQNSLLQDSSENMAKLKQS